MYRHHRRERRQRGGSADPGYDLIDDFDLIVSSFRSEYGVSIRSEEFKTMKWPEFAILLSGLGENTPLARTVAVRLEDDPHILEHFSTAQRKIRSRWRAKRAEALSPRDGEAAAAYFQRMFQKLCT